MVLRIEGFQDTIEWNAHSSEIAKFMQLGEIKTVWEGKGDKHDGTITFDPTKKQIIIDSHYFSMPSKALTFWRGLGFSVMLKGFTVEEESE